MIKIYIIGSVGSGKSTLARKLSSKLNVPHFELDNVIWKKMKQNLMLEDLKKK